MKTASFFTYTGPGRVSIARFAPRGSPKGFRILKDLAPGTWFNSTTPEQYFELFMREILKPLDPKAIVQQLTDYAAGAEPILLCYENPNDKAAWCHRRMVANWLEQATGSPVPELGFEGAAVQPLAIPVRGAVRSAQGSLFEGR